MASPITSPVSAGARNARFASGFEVGTRVRIWGRVQSREYTKKITETECEKRIAYEVSNQQVGDVTKFEKNFHI